MKNLSLTGLLLGCLCMNQAALSDIKVMALFNNKASVSVDGQMRMLRSGETSPEGVKLISASSDRAVLEVNGRRASYTVGAASGFSSANLSQSSGARVSISSDASGMYLTEGSINGQPVRFVVDTGATYVSLSATEARRLGIDYHATGRKIQVATASQVEVGYQVSLKQVKVGSLLVRDVAAVVMDSNFPPITLLGMSYLGRVNMEHSGSELRLKQR